jgi:hypothetical protein
MFGLMGFCGHFEISYENQMQGVDRVIFFLGRQQWKVIDVHVCFKHKTAMDLLI